MVTKPFLAPLLLPALHGDLISGLWLQRDQLLLTAGKKPLLADVARRCNLNALNLELRLRVTAVSAGDAAKRLEQLPTLLTTLHGTLQPGLCLVAALLDLDTAAELHQALLAALAEELLFLGELGLLDKQLERLLLALRDLPLAAYEEATELLPRLSLLQAGLALPLGLGLAV